MRPALLLSTLVIACGSDSPPPAPTPDGEPGDAGFVDTYLQHCNSMYAARVTELQIESSASFPLDCDAPLLEAIAMCRAGESANACRDRIYDQPPAISSLPAGCTGASCMRGMWLPKCADGSDACAEPEVVCPDGTRPMIYVEPARGGASDKWIFYTSGVGGPCQGEVCWSMYRYADLNGDQEQEEAMSTLHPDYRTTGSRSGAGITFGGQGSLLADFNRVEFKRCGEPASNGVGKIPLTDGVPLVAADRWSPEAPIETRRSMIDIWWRGHAIHRAALHALARADLDLDGDGVADLPPINQATTVVLAGSSDAAAYLALAGDQLAGELRALRPAVDVRLVLDGHFPPALDSEGRFAAGAPAGFNLFDQPYSETGLCGPLPDNADGIDNETCSDADWRSGPNADGLPTWYDGYTERGSVLDQSCTALHAADPTPCYDDFHVAIEHANVPIMIVADQEDQVINDKSAMAISKTYGFPLPAYRERVLAQAADIQQFWGTKREEPGAADGIAMILLKERRNGQPESQATHVHLSSTASTYATRMTKCDAGGQPIDTLTIADAIQRWTSGQLVDPYVIEDGSRAGAEFWVTGANCRAAE